MTQSTSQIFIWGFPALAWIFKQTLKLTFAASTEFKWFNLAYEGRFFVFFPEKEEFFWASPQSIAVSTCLCKSPAAAGGVRCPLSFWSPAPAVRARWPAAGGLPVSAAVWGKGTCRQGGWPGDGAAALVRCSPAYAQCGPRSPGPDGLRESETNQSATKQQKQQSY